MDYKEIAYLLGCYEIIADKEINALEVATLDKYLPASKESPVYIKRQSIFSDADDKITINVLLKELKLCRLNSEQKVEIIQLLSRIAYSDGYLAAKEKILVDDVANVLEFNPSQILEEESCRNDKIISAGKLNWYESLWGKFENIAYNIPYNQGNDKRVDKFLQGLGFAKVIEEITEEATVDLERVSRILKQMDASLVATSSEISKFCNNQTSPDKDIKAIISTISSLGELFNHIIEQSIKENIELLEKKKRNIRFFTIAFMGRTKAGKSTLHKVVTQQEDDDIGIGKVRTTRYNRSWNWDKLRIIDTPGIGAPGGEADTEIAKSIIDEADMICYIVTNDSIQETEFDFFETIKERNKPLYIILNYKGNLSNEVRLKNFLKNPTEWKDNQGPQSIKGHFDRIRERLDGKYNMDAVTIIALHLLAARLYVEHKYDQDISDKLLLGSNIETFIRAIKKEVYETGCLKKSLSIIDGVSFQIHEVSRQIEPKVEKLNTDISLLKDKQKKINQFLRTEKERLGKDLNAYFDNAKKELKNRAATFANEQYDNDNAGQNWQNDQTVKSIYARVNERISNRIEDFQLKLSRELEEISADIQLNCHFNNGEDVRGESIKNFRLGVGIFGSILTAAAPFIIMNIWNPGGWVVGIATVVIGGIISLVTSLFTSKEKKIEKAIKKMEEKLGESIDSNMDSVREEVISKVNVSIYSVSQRINSIFNAYITGAENIQSIIVTLQNNCRNQEAAINALIGFRILEFVGKGIVKDKKVKDMTNDFLRENYPVERDWEHHAFTFKYENKCTEKDKIKAQKATQMNINF